MNIRNLLSLAVLTMAIVVPATGSAQGHMNKTVIVRRGPHGVVHRTVVIQPRHHRHATMVRRRGHHTTVVHHRNGTTTVIHH